MSDEKSKENTEGIPTNETVGNNDQGNKPQENDVIERANKAVERMENENKRLEANIAELRRLDVNRIMAGRSGLAPIPLTEKELIDKEVEATLKKYHS
jgi:predicted RNase H-like nuclease (RuvC/YqgF family)